MLRWPAAKRTEDSTAAAAMPVCGEVTQPFAASPKNTLGMTCPRNTVSSTTPVIVHMTAETNSAKAGCVFLPKSE
eukprot:6078881-Pleurochrysis_carterae.AAC.1